MNQLIIKVINHKDKLKNLKVFKTESKINKKQSEKQNSNQNQNLNSDSVNQKS